MEIAPLKLISKFLALPLIALVWFYQKTLSPDHGPLQTLYPYGFCKFYPTCSQYTLDALKQDGLAALPKVVKRILSCNPRSSGGVHKYG